MTVKIPRGKGYDKASMVRHTAALDKNKISLSTYCRNNKLQIQYFAMAAEKYFPKWWKAYAKKNGLKRKRCPYCKSFFYPNHAGHEFCSTRCIRDNKRDVEYFGGNRRRGEGVIDRICQLCKRKITRTMHVHHVYGKGNDPDNEYLVAMCAGCHRAVESITVNNWSEDPASLARLLRFVWLKRIGKDKRNSDVRVSIEIKEV